MYHSVEIQYTDVNETSLKKNIKHWTDIYIYFLVFSEEYKSMEANHHSIKLNFLNIVILVLGKEKSVTLRLVTH